MNKRILVISPVPSHPQNQGNRRRVYNLLLNLRQAEYDVHFVYVRMETVDERPMKLCWGKNFYSLPHIISQSAFNPLLKNFFKSIIREIKYRRGVIPRFAYLIDDWYDESVDRYIIDLSRKINPDIVIVEYVFLSRALECFGKNVVKMIDTHDIFADRHNLYLKNSQVPHWYSTTVAEEDR